MVALNRFNQDTVAEIALLRDKMSLQGVKVILAEHWAKGGEGAEELAREVVRMAQPDSTMKFVYEDADPLWEKMRKVATSIYGAADINASRRVRALIEGLQEAGYGHYPVCVAKTQSSFSTDASLRGAPKGHIVTIRAVRLCAGAEFIVMICDDIMTMPGLPKEPCATRIDIDETGRVVGLF